MMRKEPPAEQAASKSAQGFQEQVERDLPRNYLAALAHGLLGLTGFRLVSAPTFVPAYIYLLSGSQTVVGLVLGAQFLGMALSSILGATLIEHRWRVMPVVFSVGWAMRFQVLGLALSGFFLSDHWTLVAACIFLTLFGFFNGIQSVAFSFLMSKVIPVSKRGRLTGMRNFLGGLAASGVAFLGGKYLVETNALGNGYSSTFLTAFLLTSLGISALTFIKEPESIKVRPRFSLRERIRELPELMRSETHYARFFVARALAALGTTAVPFYVLYAGKFVPLSGGTLGFMSLAFLLAQTFSSLIWGAIADRKGYRLVFIVSLCLWATSTACIMLVSELAWFVLAFCGMGAGLGGYTVASQNFVLEFGTPHERPMLIAISDTAANLMMAVGPAIGGLIAQSFDFVYVFCIAIVVKMLAVWVILPVKEPRYSQQ